jgi:acetyl-CoA carboxylase biotin carboxyl carrier protein
MGRAFLGRWLSPSRRASTAATDEFDVVTLDRELLSAPVEEMPEIEAHISGVVWKIECAVGDHIEAGEAVVVLESMKMEMPVEADEPGTVKEILCAEGEKVNEGDALIVLE